MDWIKYVVTCVYRDDNLPDDVFPKYWGNRGHKEDILCLAYYEPNVLVSASYDGDIIVWDVDGEKRLIKMNAHDDACRKGNQLAAHSHHMRKKSMDAMKCHMKKPKPDILTVTEISSQETCSTTSKSSMLTVSNTSNSPTPNPPHQQVKSNLTTPSTNGPTCKLKHTTTATDKPNTMCHSVDWDKSDLSFTDRAVEKVSGHCGQ